MQISAALGKLRASKGFQRYFKNTFWLASEKIITLVVSFVVGVLVARFLGPSDLGVISYASSIANFFAIFSQLGLTPIVTRNLVKYPERANEILGTAFWARVAAGILNIGFVLVSFLFVSEDPVTNLIIFMLVFTTIFQSFFVIDYYYQARVESKNAVQVRLIQFAVSTVLKIVLLVMQANLIWFAAIIVLNDLMNSAGLVMSYQRKAGDVRKWVFNFSYLREMMKDAYPLLISGFLVVIYTRIDQIMVKHLMGNEAVGVYSVGAKLSEMAYMIPAIIVPSIFPAVVNAKSNDESVYLKRVQMLFDLMFVMALVMAIGVTLLGPWLVTTFYGAEFEQAGTVFVVHIWTCIFVYLGYASSTWVFSENLQMVKLTRSIMGAGVNVALNFWWIPLYGVVGAALSSLVAQAFASYFGYMINRKTWPVFMMMTRSILLISPVMSVKELLTKEKSSD